MATKQQHVLVHVLELGEHDASPKKIAKIMGTKPANVSTNLFDLKKKGLVEPAGYQRYRLTEAGKKAWNEASAAVVTEMYGKSPETKKYAFFPSQNFAPPIQEEPTRDCLATSTNEELEWEVRDLSKELKYWQDKYVELALAAAGKGHP